MAVLDSNLLELIQKGGLFAYLILGLGFLILTISLEQFIRLYGRYRLKGREHFLKIKQNLVDQGIYTARDYCLRHSSPLVDVLKAGLDNLDRGERAVELAMESKVLYVIPQVKRRLPFLSAFANLSTLIGLVGTVVGLIRSFWALGATADLSAAQGSHLSQGISEAMICTALGLMVAIPGVLAHVILSSRANRIVDEIDHFSTELRAFLFDYEGPLPESEELDMTQLEDLVHEQKLRAPLARTQVEKKALGK